MKAIKGYDFSEDLNYEHLMQQFESTGLQSSNVGLAINILKEVISLKKSDPNVKLFFGYTSNMVSCGLRELIRFLCEHRFVDAIVTTCGGIEEDIMKCYHPTYIGTFRNNDRQLRDDGVN